MIENNFYKQISGQILLYHWNDLVAKAIFHSVSERRDIIKQWNQAYGKNKYRYYEIKHFEISNVSTHELSLMKLLETFEELENTL